MRETVRPRGLVFTSEPVYRADRQTKRASVYRMVDIGVKSRIGDRPLRTRSSRVAAIPRQSPLLSGEVRKPDRKVCTEEQILRDREPAHGRLPQQVDEKVQHRVKDRRSGCP